MRQYETFELRFSGPVLQKDWAQIDLSAVFTCGDETTAVRGFYDGNGQYAVRFLPSRAGEYRWKVTGFLSAEGKAVCEPARDAHGLVRAADTHFAYQDGAPFIPFGTTVYALMSQEDALVEKTLESLKNAPFNKVRMCVFPKHYDYNHNEPPCFAFEKNPEGGWDTSRPCVVFWQRLERILDRLFALDIQADLILFHPYDRWGFASMPQEDNLRYLDYLLRRLSAKPNIWWSLANEYDLCVDHKSLKDWEEIEAFVARNDPCGHLLSCHNCFCLWDFSRPHVTHASIQSKALAEIPRWLKTYQKPVIIDECCYEGNLPHFWGSISGKEMVRRFWRCYASGAYCTHGETFLDENDVLWWAKGGVLKGESPRRIAFLRKLMESLPGPLRPTGNDLAALALDEASDPAPTLAALPEGTRRFAALMLQSTRRMAPQDRWAHFAAEHVWESRCGEEAFLWYFDLQCYEEQTLRLPAEHVYRVECIDTWEMTRETLCENASGPTRVRLPGREGLAVLALRTD